MILQASYRLARFFAPVVSLMCLALCCEGLLGFVLLISRVWKMHPLALGAGSGRARKARFLRFSQPSFGFVKSSGFSHWDGDFLSQKWATSKWYPFESFGKWTVHLSILADIILLPPFQKTLHSLFFWFLKWHWFLRKNGHSGRYSDSDMAFKATIFFFQNRVVVSLGPGGDFEASKSGWGWQWGLRGWNPSCRCEIDSEDGLPSGKLT